MTRIDPRPYVPQSDSVPLGLRAAVISSCDGFVVWSAVLWTTWPQSSCDLIVWWFCCLECSTVYHLTTEQLWSHYVMVLLVGVQYYVPLGHRAAVISLCDGFVVWSAVLCTTWPQSSCDLIVWWFCWLECSTMYHLATEQLWSHYVMVLLFGVQYCVPLDHRATVISLCDGFVGWSAVLCTTWPQSSCDLTMWWFCCLECSTVYHLATEQLWSHCVMVLLVGVQYYVPLGHRAAVISLCDGFVVWSAVLCTTWPQSNCDLTMWWFCWLECSTMYHLATEQLWSHYVMVLLFGVQYYVPLGHRAAVISLCDGFVVWSAVLCTTWPQSNCDLTMWWFCWLECSTMYHLATEQLWSHYVMVLLFGVQYCVPLGHRAAVISLCDGFVVWSAVLCTTWPQSSCDLTMWWFCCLECSTMYHLATEQLWSHYVMVLLFGVQYYVPLGHRAAVISLCDGFVVWSAVLCTTWPQSSCDLIVWWFCCLECSTMYHLATEQLWSHYVMVLLFGVQYYVPLGHRAAVISLCDGFVVWSAVLCTTWPQSSCDLIVWWFCCLECSTVYHLASEQLWSHRVMVLLFGVQYCVPLGHRAAVISLCDGFVVWSAVLCTTWPQSSCDLIVWWFCCLECSTMYHLATEQLWSHYVMVLLFGVQSVRIQPWYHANLCWHSHTTCRLPFLIDRLHFWTDIAHLRVGPNQLFSYWYT